MLNNLIRPHEYPGKLFVVDVDAMVHAFAADSGAKLWSAGIATGDKNRAALEQIRKGTATKEDIDMLIGAFNITEALAIMGKGYDWLDEIKQGQDALLALSRRGVARGMRFIMTAKEWELLKLVMDLHEEQLAHATVYDIEKAHDFVQKVISLGKARAIVETRK